jgi:hypothetical protein
LGILRTLIRTAKDLDAWIDPAAENAERVWKALADDGAPSQAQT